VTTLQEPTGRTDTTFPLPDRVAPARTIPSQVGTVAACVATAVTHLLLLRRALGPDEGGFSVVARLWNEPGPHLYGPLWVDRPPGLIALFSFANHLGPWGPRLVVMGLAVLLVVLLSRAAALVGGPEAAPWAAWTAFALDSSVLLQAEQLNGEYAAIVCVAASLVCVLVALRQPPVRASLFGAAAGTAAAAAVTMKQNFFDGFVFAAVLVAGTALTDRTKRPLARAIAAGFAAGTAMVVAATLAWAGRHGGAGALYAAMYGFRMHAAEVMQHGSWTAPAGRLLALIGLALLSGLLALGALLLWHGRRSLPARNPFAWALAATGLFELVSLVAGANFWPHYALAFIPVVALSAGLQAREGRPGWAHIRRIVAAMAVLTAIASPTVALASGPGEAWTIGQWVRRSAAPDDSITVPYTHANVVAASGLRPAYPYLWSLPIRTLDPHLATLTAVLDAPHGPTWVVIWDHPRTWNLDRRDQLQRALHEHYRMVARICRHPVWLRSDTSRTLATLPTDCGGGAL
jgi:hypothetical protein